MRVLPGPGHVTCSRAITLSPSLGADLLGCIIPYKSRKGKERKQSNNLSTYAIVQTHKSHNRSVPYGSYSADPAHRETPPPLDLSPEVVKTRADAICTVPRSKEVKK